MVAQIQKVDIVPTMGIRIPFNKEMIELGKNAEGWSTSGYYQTTTSSKGNSTLRIFGTLSAPHDLALTDKHIAMWVIGSKANTEWLWTGWEPPVQQSEPVDEQKTDEVTSVVKSNEFLADDSDFNERRLSADSGKYFIKSFDIPDSIQRLSKGVWSGKWSHQKFESEMWEAENTLQGKMEINNNYISFSGQRAFTQMEDQLSLKLGDSHFENYFQFYSTNNRTEHYGRSQLEKLVLTNVYAEPIIEYLKAQEEESYRPKTSPIVIIVVVCASICLLLIILIAVKMITKKLCWWQKQVNNVASQVIARKQIQNPDCSEAEAIAKLILEMCTERALQHSWKKKKVHHRNTSSNAPMVTTEQLIDHHSFTDLGVDYASQDLTLDFNHSASIQITDQSKNCQDKQTPRTVALIENGTPFSGEPSDSNKKITIKDQINMHYGLTSHRSEADAIPDAKLITQDSQNAIMTYQSELQIPENTQLNEINPYESINSVQKEIVIMDGSDFKDINLESFQKMSSDNATRDYHTINVNPVSVVPNNPTAAPSSRTSIAIPASQFLKIKGQGVLSRKPMTNISIVTLQQSDLDQTSEEGGQLAEGQFDPNSRFNQSKRSPKFDMTTRETPLMSIGFARATYVQKQKQRALKFKQPPASSAESKTVKEFISKISESDFDKMHVMMNPAYGFVDNPPLMQDIKKVICYLLNDGLGEKYNMEIICEIVGEHRRSEALLRKSSKSLKEPSPCPKQVVARASTNMIPYLKRQPTHQFVDSIPIQSTIGSSALKSERSIMFN